MSDKKIVVMCTYCRKRNAVRGMRSKLYRCNACYEKERRNKKKQGGKMPYYLKLISDAINALKIANDNACHFSWNPALGCYTHPITGERLERKTVMEMRRKQLQELQARVASDFTVQLYLNHREQKSVD